ncbi:MAG: hypothetical protein FJ010_02165 [Chloroflexi bacterium]|nr:hypothetical protein [Chloroflexota bacterium]
MKLQKKIYENCAEKKRDFIFGVILFVGLNALLYPLTMLASSLTEDYALAALMGFWQILPFLVNIGVVIYFALTRQWIALGMLGTFAGLNSLAIILSIIAGVVCFFIYAWTEAGATLW